MVQVGDNSAKACGHGGLLRAGICISPSAILDFVICDYVYACLYKLEHAKLSSLVNRGDAPIRIVVMLLFGG